MIYKIVGVRALLVACTSATLLAGHASGQTAPAAAAAAAAAPSAAMPVPHKSAFDGYKAYSDDKMTSWKAANEDVARIGGWRAYAKQAQQLDNAPGTKAGEAKPKATP